MSSWVEPGCESTWDVYGMAGIRALHKVDSREGANDLYVEYQQNALPSFNVIE